MPIVNQLTTASRNAMLPSIPVSPPTEIRSRRLLLAANPSPTPPTRIRGGVARTSRNAVVRGRRWGGGERVREGEDEPERRGQAVAIERLRLDPRRHRVGHGAHHSVR